MEKENQEDEKALPEVENLVSSEVTAASLSKQHDDGGKRFLGIFLGILSAFLYSVTAVLACRAHLFHGNEIALITCVAMLVPMLVFALARGHNPLGPKEHRKLCLFRALLIVLVLTLNKISIKLINPSDANAIFQSNVIIVAILSRFVYKEMLSIVHFFCIFMTITGN